MYPYLVNMFKLNIFQLNKSTCTYFCRSISLLRQFHSAVKENTFDSVKHDF